MTTTTLKPEEKTEQAPKLSDSQRIQNWLDRRIFDFEIVHTNKENVYADRWRVDLYKNRADAKAFSRNLIIERSFFLRVAKDEIQDITINV